MNKQKNLKVISYITLGCGLLCLVFALILPFIFANNGNILGLDKGSEAGNAIGGLTAPFVGILGALIVFISFLKQAESNILLEKELNKTNFFNEYEEIIKLLSFLNQEFNKLFDTNSNIEVTIKNKVKTINKDKFFLAKCFVFFDILRLAVKNIEQFEDPIDKDVSLRETNFNYKGLLRIKFAYYYNSEFIYFVKSLKMLNDSVPKLREQNINFGRILTHIESIEIVLNKDNRKYWGLHQSNINNRI